MENIINDITKRASPGVNGANLEKSPSQEDIQKINDEVNAELQKSSKVTTDKDDNTVYLNVYDLDDQFVQVNNALSTIFTGAFHAGIQCYGMEYCYGMTEEERSGVYWHPPRMNPVHIYRKTHVLGKCNLSREAFQRFVKAKCEIWMGHEYHLIRKNCISFCEDLATDLQVSENFPAYVSTLMNTAVKAVDSYNAATTFLQNASQAYVSTVDAIGDDMVEGINNASTQITKTFGILGDGIRKVVPNFFNMTFPKSDDEEEENLRKNVPPGVVEYMSVPAEARQVDKTLSSFVQKVSNQTPTGSSLERSRSTEEVHPPADN